MKMMWKMLATAALAALEPVVAAETKPDDPKAVAVEKEFRAVERDLRGGRKTFRAVEKDSRAVEKEFRAVGF